MRQFSYGFYVEDKLRLHPSADELILRFLPLASNRISVAYISSLLTWTPDHISRGDQGPREYLALLLSLVIKIQRYEFRNEMDPELARINDANFEDDLHSVQWCLKYFNKMSKAFKKLQRNEIGGHPTQLQGLPEQPSDLESLW
jgi:hypothetical protein